MTKAQADEVNRQWDEYHERQACGGLPLDQWIVKTVNEANRALMKRNYGAAQQKYLELSAKTRDKNQRKQFRSLFHRCELMAYNHPDINHVHINKSGNETEACPVSDKKVISIQQAIKKMPLPCDAEYCTCFYTAVFDDELPLPKANKKETKIKGKSWWQRLLK